LEELTDSKSNNSDNNIRHPDNAADGRDRNGHGDNMSAGQEKPRRKTFMGRLLLILFNILLVIILIPPSLAFLFRSPEVQTLTARLTTYILSKNLKIDADIKTIKLDLKSGITIKGLKLNDQKGMPMIEVGELRAKPVFADFGFFGLVFARLELDHAFFRYARYRESGDFNLKLLINKFAGNDTTAPKGSFKLRTKRLILKDFRFQFYDEQRNYESKKGMNYANIIFDSINLDASRFHIINDSLNFLINNLSTVERSGFRISNMSTDFSISNSGLHAQNLLMDYENSHLDLDLDFNYSSYRSYAKFVDSVEIVADIRPSVVMMSDIRYYADVMSQMPDEVGITGKVQGTVRNIKGEDMRLHYGKNTRLSFTGSIKGLPDFYNANIFANIHDFSTTTCDIRKFRLPVNSKTIDLTAYQACFNKIRGKVKFRGSPRDFNADVNVRSPDGDLAGSIRFLNTDNDTLHFEITAKGDSVRLDKLLKQEDLLGNAKFDVRLQGDGHSLDDLAFKSGGTLYDFDFDSYRYKRIRFSGDYYNDSAWGNLVVGDKNLMVKADVFAKLAKVPDIKIKADLRQINLDNLIPGIDRDMGVSSKIDMDIKGIEPDLMTGTLNLEKTTLSFGKDIYKIDTIALTKNISSDSVHSLTLKSAVADLSLNGKYRISTFAGRIMHLLDHYLDVIPSGDSLAIYPSGEYADLNFDLKQDDLLEEQFLPGFSVTGVLPVKARFDFDQNRLEATSDIEEITYQGIEFRKNKVLINTDQGRLSMKYNNVSTILHDSTSKDKQVFGIDNFSADMDAGNDSLNYGISWKNNDTLMKNSADIKGSYVLRDDLSVFRIRKMDMVINDTVWGIDPKNRITTDSLGTSFEQWNFYGGNSKLGLTGKYPRKNGDSLQVAFHSWDLSNFDMLTSLANFDIDGIVTGNMEFSKVNGNLAFVSNILIDSLGLNKVYLGNASLINTWDNRRDAIDLQSEINRRGSSGLGKIVSVNGSYYPFKDQNSLDLTMSFNRFKIKAIESFFSDMVSDVEGMASGELVLKGSLDKPVLTGYVDTHRSAMRINYLNTKYSFSNVIKFEPDGINFDNLVIYDTLGNSANVDGSLKYKYFKNAQFDVSITTDKLLFFNTTRKMNDIYYGTAITSGKIHLSGSPSNLLLDMNVTTQSGTHVSLPLDYSVEISDKDYIVFVEHHDTTEAAPKEMEKVVWKKEKKQAYDIRLGMEITPQARVSIFLPSDMGRIESQGSGNLTLKANSDGDFNLIGDYVVESGLFNLTLANLISKRFELVKGGRISWSGDPYDAIINIKGLYKLKTNLSSLGIVIDSSSTYGNKVTVECYVDLKNKLLDPDMRFEILMPDLDPDLKRLVYAQLDTTNQAMMNEQMISLLVLGTFSYSNASNISLSSSYYTVLSNQLSNMLSKLSDDFDIGINYKPGDAVSQQEFEVALSTQFLDDRLTVEGHFGMTYDRSNQNASNIVGDVDLSYALTQDGRWILKAYNHSNVNSWYNYNSYDKVSPYTQGVGIAYRKEFNNIAEFFRRTRPRTKKKNNGNKNEN